jgi:hypothetical protein
MSEETVDWQGKSGRVYRYWVHPIDQQLVSKPGNYAYAKRGPNAQPLPVYFGETENLADRLNANNHERRPCAVRNGANLICAHVNDSGRDARLSEEADLRARYDPPCNRQ